MRLAAKCLPTGSLPYENEKLVTQMMVRLFEDIPYLPLLPKISENETILNRTLGNLPWFVQKQKKIHVKDSSEKFNQEMILLDKCFNEPNSDNTLEKYKVESVYMNKYLAILNRIKPKNTVVNLMGPFTISQMIEKAEFPQILIDKMYRKIIVQTVCAKAMWIAGKIKEASPETTPLIVLEEPLLYMFGTAVRETEELTRDIVINLFAKTVQKLHQVGCLVGIQSFGKCDWQVVIDAGADLISFDAYNNPNNLGIIAEKVNNFLIAGGYINWGIVPAKTENQVKTLTIDYLVDRFNKTTMDVANQGVNINLIQRRALVSVQQDMHDLPIIFAEKALILNTKLAQRIAAKTKITNPQ